MTRSSFKQRGLSLISLMIALTIGVFLLAGLFTVWFQTRQTFQTQGQLTQLQDSERMALTLMANTVQTGGYFPIAANYSSTPPSTPYTQGNVFTVTSPFTAAGQFIYGTHSSTGNDTLTIRYMTDSNTLDCQGQTEPNATLVTNTFQIDTNGNLTCTVSYSSTTKTAQLISGIASFTVLYGVSTTNSGSTTQYMTADKVSAQWPSVRSINLQLQFANPLAGQPGQNALPVISRLVAVTQTKST
ncbi:PilW family protein [Dyella choica]|nr:PilW family protein [Dyella choica]